MKVVKRGTAGIALFVSGVLSIPAVVAVDGAHASNLDTSLAAASSSSASGSSRSTLTYNRGATTSRFGSMAGSVVGPALSSAARGILAREALGAAKDSTSAITQARIRGFGGVAPGGTVSGQVQIRAIVTGTLNAITYTLNGPMLISYDSLWAPYLFSPDGMGLDTTRLPNGIYTLTAMPRDSAGVPATLTFRIANPRDPVLASSLASGASLSYFNR